LEEIANADLIIEAAPEQLKLKQEILRELAELNPEDPRAELWNKV